MTQKHCSKTFQGIAPKCSKKWFQNAPKNMTPISKVVCIFYEKNVELYLVKETL